VLLQQQAGTALDPALVRAFIEILPGLDPEAVAAAGPAAATGSGSALDHIAVAHREVHALFEIAAGLNASLRVEEIMAVLSTQLERLVPFSAGALFLWDPDSRRFRCRRAVGAAREVICQTTPSSLAELSSWLPIAAADGSITLQSRLIAPLESKGRVIGALIVYAGYPEAYDEDHRRLLDRVARQATSAVANALAFEQAHEASLTDTLTGLANRRALMLQLERDLARASREQATLSVLLLDVDDLKRLNDTSGHEMGDRALKGAGAVIAASQRPYDLCARYGGDEFVAVLWDCDATQAAARCLELQRSIMSTRVPVDETTSVFVSVSVGVASYPMDGTTADALLAVADQRMYADKAARRHAQANYAGTLQDDASFRLAV
jgi:diguanylate cyclase (GGDEF)-like protein